jgi:hypothetical protein
MEAENAIAGINCDIPHFLEDMTLEEPVYVCINSSEEMARGEQAIAGQLWIQGDRQMTDSSTVPEGMADTTDSGLLAAVAEAVSWNHASQNDEGRKGQRVIIYPKDLTQLDELLSTCDPNADPEDGHPIAYEIILRESAKYEATPQFWREDSTPVVSDPVLSEVVPEWMAKARQVATGNRKRVLEDGRDVENSSDEDDPNMKPDELAGCYTAEMNPKEGPKVLTPAQAAFQRAAGKAMALLPKAEPERKPTPLGTPVNSDEEDLSWDQQRAANLGKKMAGKKKPPYTERIPDPVVQVPAKGAPLEIKKAAASPRAPADQPKGAKAPTPMKGQVKGQESPGSKDPHPMATRAQQARRTLPPSTSPSEEGSGAGGFRGVAGSGQKRAVRGSSSPASKHGS